MVSGPPGRDGEGRVDMAKREREREIERETGETKKKSVLKKKNFFFFFGWEQLLFIKN